jgi:hypothetical protein
VYGTPRSLTEEIHDEYRNELELTCEGCRALVTSQQVGCKTEDPGSEMVAGRQWPAPEVTVFCETCHESGRCGCDDGPTAPGSPESPRALPPQRR